MGIEQKAVMAHHIDQLDSEAAEGSGEEAVLDSLGYPFLVPHTEKKPLQEQMFHMKHWLEEQAAGRGSGAQLVAMWEVEDRLMVSLASNQLAGQVRRRGVFPAFELVTALGRIERSVNLRGTCYVVMFYNGVWCPADIVALHALQGIMNFMARLRTRVLCVTSESPVKSLEMMDKLCPTFTICCDPSGQLARACSLRFSVPSSLVSMYSAQYSVKLRKLLGRADGEDVCLDIPAVYLVDQNGNIEWCNAELSFYNRFDLKQLVHKVRNLYRRVEETEHQDAVKALDRAAAHGS
eukprot:CAMPEP_0175142514 /NCGR_PEP_ID=MMETSP0087-20121206/12858_1 /TAXON_ID=136419 /ORGANISM="Unknown Unknown, Strain D1" /LENGTH=292 /DNA_ID=CAMNT_0016426359 /DNA_START=33 /DNA_END=911 /DNA_ORIENTATION=+